MKRATAFVFVGLIILALVIAMSVYTVDQRKSAIKFQLGEVVAVQTQPGLYFLMPILQNVRLYDTRIQTLEAREPGQHLLEPADVVRGIGDVRGLPLRRKQGQVHPFLGRNPDEHHPGVVRFDGGLEPPKAVEIGADVVVEVPARKEVVRIVGKERKTPHELQIEPAVALARWRRLAGPGGLHRAVHGEPY